MGEVIYASERFPIVRKDHYKDDCYELSKLIRLIETAVDLAESIVITTEAGKRMDATLELKVLLDVLLGSLIDDEDVFDEVRDAYHLYKECHRINEATNDQ